MREPRREPEPGKESERGREAEPGGERQIETEPQTGKEPESLGRENGVPEGEETRLEAGMVEHVRMVTSLIEGREVSVEEVVEMLERAVRQHSMVRESGIDQAVRRMLEQPP